MKAWNHDDTPSSRDSEKTDPLAVLVRGFTHEEKERVREYWQAEQLERAKKRDERVSRVPSHLAILWYQWNRKCPGSAEQLAYEFGKHFKSEVLREWNKPTVEELEAHRKQKRRKQYNKYMRTYLRKYRAKKVTDPLQK